jgi:hypothetical protein
MFYYWFILWKKLSDHEAKNVPILWMCSLLAESICANFMQSLRQKPKSISIPFFEKFSKIFKIVKFLQLNYIWN